MPKARIIPKLPFRYAWFSPSYELEGSMDKLRFTISAKEWNAKESEAIKTTILVDYKEDSVESIAEKFQDAYNWVAEEAFRREPFNDKKIEVSEWARLTD